AFLLHDVHRGQPLLFQSRHALSFLRGPMTRDQVERLMAPVKRQLAQAGGQPGAPLPASQGELAAPVAIRLCPKCRAAVPLGPDRCPACSEVLPRPAFRVQDREFKAALQRAAPAAELEPTEQKPPELAEGMTQFYLPLGNPVAPAGAQLLYQARLLGSGEVAFLDKRRGIQHRLVYPRPANPPAVGQPVRWLEAEQVSETAAPGPQAAAHWTEVPEAIQTAKKLKALEKGYADFLYDNAKITIRENSKLGLV